MIQFERSTDYELIRRILIHPKIYGHISDDGSPPADQYRPIQHDAMWYVLVTDVMRNGVELLGLWVFAPENAICWQVHTALLPIARGLRGHLAARLLPAWIWQNTPCRRIVTYVPSTNRLALQFAIKAGMTVYGTNEAAFLKRGVYCDLICLGISAPKEVEAPQVSPAVLASEMGG